MGEGAPLPVHDGHGLRIAVARSRYNEHITSGLLAGAEEYLTASGADYDVFEVPGAFELPLLCAELAEGPYDALVALGAVVDGETDHYEHVASRASEGLMQVSLQTRKPVSFGVLTVRHEEHAVARSRPGSANKGAEAAAAAVETALTMRNVSAPG
jgi:6,7-dimethyl-8-ribityllumazine synthase